MTIGTIYLICFLFGAGMSVLSLLTGALHLHIHPKFHLPHHSAPHIHIHGPEGGRSIADLTFFNFSALMAFLTWFGGTGYLLTRFASLAAIAALAAAIVLGVIGASIINWFLVRVLMRREKELESVEIAGTIGTLTIPLRENGTAEIVYSQHGTRRSAAARTEDGSPLPKGKEVVITRFDRGIAYVRPFEDAPALAPSQDLVH